MTEQTIKKTSDSNTDDLWKLLEEEWNKIPKDYIDKLYFSMCSRIHAVIAAKGGNRDIKIN